MPDLLYSAILGLLSKAYHGYRESHGNCLPSTIWVSRGLYSNYKDNLTALTRFTYGADDFIPSVERLKYKSADVRPVEIAGIFILKTTRCYGRYNG